MKIYTYDQFTGEYTGTAVADKSPLEPGVFLIPAGATKAAPPTVLGSSQIAIFSGGKWIVKGKDTAGEDEKQTVDVETAVNKKISQIVAKSYQLQEENFSFDSHQFYADQWATKTLESCLSVSLALGLDDADPVRVPSPLQPGYWLTADLDETGNRLAIPLTLGELKQAVVALYDRNANVWGKEMIHKATVEAMAAGGSTASEILAYDHESGWE